MCVGVRAALVCGRQGNASESATGGIGEGVIDADGTTEGFGTWYGPQGLGLERDRIRRELAGLPGGQLVVVRYSPLPSPVTTGSTMPLILIMPRWSGRGRCDAAHRSGTADSIFETAKCGWCSKMRLLTTSISIWVD